MSRSDVRSIRSFRQLSSLFKNRIVPMDESIAPKGSSHTKRRH